MNINGKHFETISISDGSEPVVQVIDQTLLPFRFVIKELNTVRDDIRNNYCFIKLPVA